MLKNKEERKVKRSMQRTQDYLYELQEVDSCKRGMYGEIYN